MPRVTNKIALVTGAASNPGIGSATAERLVQEGAKVFLTDIDLEGAERIATAIRSMGGDATADWERVVSAVLRTHGRLDVLVNNAGIAVLGKVNTITPQAWAKQMEVNVTSVFLGTRRAVSVMRTSGGGSIINLASVVGNLVGVPDCGAYSASKGGVKAFSKAIAMEVAPDNIRVNCVYPGLIRTNIHKASMKEIPGYFEAMVASVPLGRMGEPADIANCILFLASDDASYITGTEITVDGGFSAR
jgi:NAD(P)-dependent dehydrogenase (short-subunit alcohol dehydrogenase family)